ncbi:MAG: DUF6770 family protein [Flavobacteriales bacterium]
MRKTLLFLALLAGLSSIAQTREFQNVLRARARTTGGVIMKNNELGGYYSFYETDKVDGKNRAFRVALMDDNLGEAGEIRIVRPKNSILMECVFNGKAFLLFFLNDKNVEMETYDTNGKKLGSKVYEDVTKWERTRAMMAAKAGENGEVNQSIFPIGDGGFLKQSITKGETYGYQLTAYNNDLTVRWETDAPKSDMIEAVDVIEVTNDFIVGSMYKMKNRMTMPDFALAVLFDVKTGKKLWEKELTVDGQKMTVLNAFPAEGKDELVFTGEFFGPKDNIVKDKSKGLYAMRTGYDGVPTQTEFYSWEKDILPLVPADEKGKKELDRILFHKMVRLKSGSIYCIGEEYKKVMGATGGIQITTKNLVVLELGPDLKMKGCSVIPKSKQRTEFPMEYVQLSASVLAQLTKQMGFFDYEFTTQDKVGDRFFVTYVGFDRGKNESGDKVGSYIGTVIGDGKSKPTVDKYDVDAKDATFFRVLPAKAGYVAIYEYSKKLKRINFRLEKMAY